MGECALHFQAGFYQGRILGHGRREFLQKVSEKTQEQNSLKFHYSRYTGCTGRYSLVLCSWKLTCGL